MTDAKIKAITAAGVALHLAAVGLGLAGQGWRWPLIAALVPTAIGVLGFAVQGSPDTFKRCFQGYALAVLMTAGMHAATAHPDAALILRVAFAVQTLLLLLILIFFLTFKLNRLW